MRTLFLRISVNVDYATLADKGAKAGDVRPARNVARGPDDENRRHGGERGQRIRGGKARR